MPSPVSAPSAVSAPAGRRVAPSRVRPGAWLAALLVTAFLLAFLVLPVARVVVAAFVDADGSPTWGHLANFFGQALMREAFANSLYVATLSALFAALIAVPLAYFTVRFEFRGALLIQTLGVLPLVMPPFVGAVALQLIYGRSGSLNLLLGEHFGFTLPIMDGLNGVVFVEAIHYFPFILMNLTVALRNIDGAMEEAAQNLGCRGWRLFRRVIFPLALPGFVAGASLVFVKVFDDLGTPLVMGQTNLLAPQAYLRITQVGLEDPAGYVISVLMIAFSIAAMALSAWTLKGRDFSTVQKGGTRLQRRRLAPLGAAMAYGWIVLVLLIVLSPHLGVLLLSLAKVWSFSPLPDAYTLAHYTAVFADSSAMMRNTLLYCGLAAGLDVLLGVAIAALMLRTTLPARQWLDWIASASLAVPGIVLAIGYLRLYKGLTLPGTDVLFTSTWVLIMLAYAVRRLPYALRSCVAALQQLHISLEEAAQSLGATPPRAMRRVMLPLMTGGLLAGFVTSFITAAVELSATILLVSADSQAPMSYGIYLYMQSVAGRGPGAALGVLAIAVVALGTWASHVVAERSGGEPLRHRTHGHSTESSCMKKVRVQCRHIDLAYGGTEVLKDLSLDIEPGEFFALLGPSGSGKSTLLRLLAGFARQQRGQVLVDGVDISEQPPWQRQVGMVFQNYALWPHLSVWDNVAFGLVERRVDKASLAQRVRSALDTVGLSAYGERRPNQLSGGQQQRVALARTLVTEPQVLLLDEPLSNLDKSLRVQMRQELVALQRRLGLTTIFVTHDQDEAMGTADRMAVLDQGRLQQVGTPVELYDAPASLFVAGFVGTMNQLPWPRCRSVRR